VNPRRAGLVADPAAWSRRSCRETIGLERPSEARDRIALLEHVAPNPLRARVLFGEVVPEPVRAR
jgi:hypothetical protein